MVKTKIENVKSKKKGFRDGVTKEDILNLTPLEKEHIKLMREISEKFIKDEDALKCAYRCDYIYQQVEENLSMIEAMLAKMLRSQRSINKDKADLVLKETKQTYPNTDTTMTMEDLELEIISNHLIVNDCKCKLWTLIPNLYRNVGHLGLDKKVTIDDERFKKVVTWIKDTLKKNGIDLYKERF